MRSQTASQLCVDAVEPFQPPSTHGLNQVHQSHTVF